MKIFLQVLFVFFASITLLTAPNARTLSERNIPIPGDVSPELQKAMENDSNIDWKMQPKNPIEWKELVDKYASVSSAMMPDLLRKLGVTYTKSEIAGVQVFILEPAAVPEKNKNKILLYFHGGGYVFNPGVAGLDEGSYLASIGGFKVIAVDYRMAPEFPYPAALDDAMKVYEAMLKTYQAKNIGVFGSSTGGGMTLALCLRAKKEGLPLPGAIAAGTPWSDLSKTGDSYFTNENIDNVLVSYDGLLEGMAKAYANGHDLKDPMLSPVYGDMSGFPPTIIGTGTRDLFLSNSVRVHRKLREANVPSDLLVIEGLSHEQYVLLTPDAPETKYYFGEVAKFFDKYLGK